MLFNKVIPYSFVSRKVILDKVPAENYGNSTVRRVLEVLNSYHCEIRDLIITGCVADDAEHSITITITLEIRCRNIDWADIEEGLNSLMYDTTLTKVDEKISTKMTY